MSSGFALRIQQFSIGFLLAAVSTVPAIAGVSGAIFTTDSSGTAVNQNIYSQSTDVYLSGGPQNTNAAGLDDGVYFFQVTDPSGSTLLSTDNAVCRQLMVVGGRVAGASALSGGCIHANGTFNAASGVKPVQLAPFAATPNNGGEYKAWLVAAAGVTISPTNPKVMIFSNSSAKTDNFKIVTGSATTGSIQIVKNTAGGDGTFTFTSNFGLTSLTTVNGTATQIFSGLAAGSTYTVTEKALAGWTQTSAICNNGVPGAIRVIAGALTVCTITNTKQTGVPSSLSLACPAHTGQVGAAFSSSAVVSGGTPPYVYSVASGSLPTGLSLNAATGAITGTPATSGTFGFSIGVKDSLGATAVSSCTQSCVGNSTSWNFTSPAGVLGNTQTYTVNGITITAHGFTNAGTAAALFGKTEGGDENGLGISGTTDNEIDTTHFIQIDLANVISSGALAAQMIVNSVQSGEGFNLYGSNTLGTLGTVIVSAATADNTSFAIPGFPTYRYLGIRASSGNVLIGAVSLPLINCTITVAPATVSTGAIKVIKNTVGGNGTFSFTSNFGLTTLTTSNNTATATFSGLTAGASYSVFETPSANWSQTSAVCNHGLPSAIQVLAGLTTVCTITNTFGTPAATGSIVVVKNTVGGDGTFNFTSNFGLSEMTTSGGTASQTFASLDAGSSYSLSEAASAGWTQTGAVCTNGTVDAITVVAGAVTVCTVTNTRISLSSSADVTVTKSHSGNFTQGDTGDTYTLTVRNTGQASTTGAVTVTEQLPAGLTLASMEGTGWTCNPRTLTCFRTDALAAGGSYPPITVTVNVAVGGSAFTKGGTTSFQAGDLFVSMADGTVQWRRSDWSLVQTLTAAADGQAKGTAFDVYGNLYVTHWYSSGSAAGNDVAKFDPYGVAAGLFGSGYNCNPSSIVFDRTGNAYVGQADCSGTIMKFDSQGNSAGQFAAATENRGTYDIALDDDQCTLYYTSEGPSVKRYNVCTMAQLSNFNTAALPDPVAGAMAILPSGGGMLVANSSVVSRLDSSGGLVRTYSAAGHDCWLGVALAGDGTSFWASDWCSSTAARFDLASGNLLESQTASGSGFMLKRIAVRGNSFNISVTNVATVSGGGDVNADNNSASDVTIINPPAVAIPVGDTITFVNAASNAPTVAAGGIAAVYGANLASSLDVASTVPLPTSLGGGSVQIGGHGAPLFFASPSQMNLQIPWELAGQNQVAFSASGSAGASAKSGQTMKLAAFAPGIFTFNGAGSGQAIALIAGTTMLAGAQGKASIPATRGGYISVYCTGLGPVTHQPATGVGASTTGPLSMTTTAPAVTIGGVPAQVSFSGLAPGMVGVYQVNVQVPRGTETGSAVPVTLSIGGAVSNMVTIAIQ